MAERKPVTPADATVDPAESEIPVDTTNAYAVHAGTNMMHSTHAMAGRAKWVAIGAQVKVAVRTKQEAYRLAAWLVVLAEANDLPDEEGAHDFDTVIEAVEGLQ